MTTLGKTSPGLSTDWAHETACNNSDNILKVKVKIIITIQSINKCITVIEVTGKVKFKAQSNNTWTFLAMTAAYRAKPIGQLMNHTTINKQQF